MKLRVWTLNVRGSIMSTDPAQLCRNHNLDVLVLTEKWTQAGTLIEAPAAEDEQVIPSGYVSVHMDGDVHNSNGAGSNRRAKGGIYVLSRLDIKRWHVIRKDNVQAVIMLLDDRNGKEEVTVGGVHVRSEITEGEARAVVKELRRELRYRAVLVGDFNARHPCWSARVSNAAGRVLQQCW